MLGEIGLRREDVYITNVVRCRPPGNRDPLPDEIEACRAVPARARCERSSPRVIVTLGNFATRVILDRQVSISRVRGQRFEVDGRTVIPTFHPAAILHGGGEAELADAGPAFGLPDDPGHRWTSPRPSPSSPQEQLGLF